MASSIAVVLTNPAIPTGSKTFTFSMSDAHFDSIVAAQILKYTQMQKPAPTTVQAMTSMVTAFISGLKRDAMKSLQDDAAKAASDAVPPIVITAS